MSKRPTIHVTNASSRKLHRGRVFNIMARPRHFELFEGPVVSLAPHRDDLDRVRRGSIDLAEYRERYDYAVRRQLVAGLLAPGQLTCPGPFHGKTPVVADGDTLVCACSKAAAAEGRCHRVWAARWLHEAGWRVVLDGQATA